MQMAWPRRKRGARATLAGATPPTEDVYLTATEADPAPPDLAYRLAAEADQAALDPSVPADPAAEAGQLPFVYAATGYAGYAGWNDYPHDLYHAGEPGAADHANMAWPTAFCGPEQRPLLPLSMHEPPVATEAGPLFGGVSPKRPGDGTQPPTLPYPQPPALPVARPSGAARLPRSLVWLYFSRATAARSGALTTRCSLCNDELAYYHSTTSLDKHLVSKHSIDVRDLGTPAAAGAGLRLAARRSQHGPASSRPSTAAAPPPTQFAPAHRPGTEHPRPPASGLRRANALLRYTVQGDGATGALSDPAFLDLLRTLGLPRWTLDPAELQARMRREYDAHAAVLRAQLEAAPFVSLTVERWLSGDGHPFAEIAVHFADGPALVSRTLACSVLPYPHRQDALAAVLAAAILEFGLAEKVAAIAAEDATDLNRALPLLPQALAEAALHSGVPGRSLQPEILPIGCLGRAINATVQSAMVSVDQVSELLAKLRSWAAFFGTHSSHVQALHRVQDVLGEPHAVPLADDPALWTSTLSMLRAAETVTNSLDVYLSTVDACDRDRQSGLDREALACLGAARLSSCERSLIPEVYHLLEPFAQATALLTGSTHCSISLTQPVISVVVDRLQALASSLSQPAAVALLAHLSKISSFHVADPRHALDFHLAVALDPSLCHRADESAVARIHHLLAVETAKTQAVSNSASAPSTVHEPASSKGFDFHQALSSRPRAEGAPGMDEFSLFRQAYARNATSPLAYWHANRHTFPRLYAIAQRLFVMQATAAPCDRLFGEAGPAMMRKRASLNLFNANQVLFLMSAYRLDPRTM